MDSVFSTAIKQHIGRDVKPFLLIPSLASLLSPVGRCLWPPLKTCPSTPRGPRALAGPPLPS